MKGDPLNIRTLSGSGLIFQDFQGVYAFGRSEKVVGSRRGLKGSGSSKEIHENLGLWRDLVRSFRTSKKFMLLEGQRRWLEVGEVSSVVDCERRSVKSQDSIGIWSDFSGLPRGLCLWKVREGGWRPERSEG